MVLDEDTGIDVLGNLIEASQLSPNGYYYGSYHNAAHLFISYSHDPDYRYLVGCSYFLCCSNRLVVVVCSALTLAIAGSTRLLIRSLQDLLIGKSAIEITIINLLRTNAILTCKMTVKSSFRGVFVLVACNQPISFRC